MAILEMAVSRPRGMAGISKNRRGLLGCHRGKRAQEGGSQTRGKALAGKECVGVNRWLGRLAMANARNPEEVGRRTRGRCGGIHRWHTLFGICQAVRRQASLIRTEHLASEESAIQQRGRAVIE